MILVFKYVLNINKYKYVFKIKAYVLLYATNSRRVSAMSSAQSFACWARSASQTRSGAWWRARFSQSASSTSCMVKKNGFIFVHHNQILRFNSCKIIGIFTGIFLSKKGYFYKSLHTYPKLHRMCCMLSPNAWNVRICLRENVLKNIPWTGVGGTVGTETQINCKL